MAFKIRPFREYLLSNFVPEFLFFLFLTTLPLNDVVTSVSLIDLCQSILKNSAMIF
jgi:hypothetical protein